MVATGAKGKPAAAPRRDDAQPPPAPRSAVDHNAALCELIHHTTRLDLHREPGAQLAEFICRVFALDAVAIFDHDLDKTYDAGQWFAEPENSLRNIHLFERSGADPETGLTWEVLRIGSLPIGALLVRGDLHRAHTAAVANLIATTFDRYHSRANLNRTETAREAERLRSTVLDSLAHAYKTPLTAIRAAATGVVEIGALSKAQAELLSIVEEQTAALNDLTMRLLTTARLEGKELSLHTAPIALAPLLEEATLALTAQAPGTRVRLSVEPEELSLHCDRSLLAALLEQYLDNAAKYSDFGSPITIEARQEGDSVLLSVHNFGPAIPAAECERIFDRYVRGSATAAGTSGTGIGLSIARAAAQAHGGDVWVNSNAAEGTTFWASLPLQPKAGRHDA
jgi:two-component system sensor histidine kinase KdpD